MTAREVCENGEEEEEELGAKKSPKENQRDVGVRICALTEECSLARCLSRSCHVFQPLMNGDVVHETFISS